MVCSQRRIVQSPPLEIVKVPLGDGQLSRDLHPVSLGFVVAVHGGILKSWKIVSWKIHHQSVRVPEYPQRPAAHLNKPTTININGRISHCDTELRAGQRNAASG